MVHAEVRITSTRIPNKEISLKIRIWKDTKLRQAGRHENLTFKMNKGELSVVDLREVRWP